MFDKVLIANRGAIACRILRTLERLKIASVAVYSQPDRDAPHVTRAGSAVCLGPGPPAESYLRVDRIIDAARDSGAQAIHPGYGFLSESAEFAEACEGAGIAFIGPTTAQIRDFGLKHRARALASAHGLPLLPATDLLAGAAEACARAARLGFPLMLKSTAGGGGIGMQLCHNAAELEKAFSTAERLAGLHFGDNRLYLERYIEEARHLEVQLLGDGHGTVVGLGERDCSVQRRNQKVIEEAPAPCLDEPLRTRLQAAALRLGESVAYRSAGTVEFIYDRASEQFYFLEVNTRLQVEHGVTEEVTGIDLVEWMIRIAAGERLTQSLPRQPHGHAIQARVYAEDPARGFRPAAGLLTHVQLPAGVRLDGWIASGAEVTSFYDPLLLKVIAHGATREAALASLQEALAQTRIDGIETNLEYLRAVLRLPALRAGRQSTRLLSTLHFNSRSVEVLKPGTHTSVQDFPGRLGYWNVGVPPSGPMDDLAFRFANRILGNAIGAAGLEMAGEGPALQFACDTTIALTGARMRAELDGNPVGFWEPVAVRAGAVLTLIACAGAGQRAYLAVRGGFDLPRYLGSSSTFALGRFGGHAGRVLRAGDVLKLTAECSSAVPTNAVRADPPPARYADHWTIGVTYGPHGAPDFFTPADIDTFFATDWKVHYNSSRTGIRLVGPKPEWARSDGGEAGLHPSNIHDNAYAIGAIDYTGDMPVILGPDGPSLGGFVCPAVVTRRERWKLGQLSPGDTIRFSPSPANVSPVILRLAETIDRPAVCYRHCGEDYLLIEYGPARLDLDLRFRAHALMQALAARNEVAIIDLTPGIRSLQVHYDPDRLPQSALLDLLLALEQALPALEALEVASRCLHLPLSWDDPATRLAIERYNLSVRKDAPWYPSNIEFIRRINGLESIEEVKRIVFDAEYLVLGLGDVYLGAPVATPLDPRHRLITTKYNPARTWTPENAVGIGGAYLCVYGMEGPGGYQFVGRTLQMWNHRVDAASGHDVTPWLLRFFDVIRFYPVSAEELLEIRESFPRGRHRLAIEPRTLSLRDYRRFLRANADSIEAFRQCQRAAFDAERQRWRQMSDASTDPELEAAPAPASTSSRIPAGCQALSSPVTGSIWQISAQPGQHVPRGYELALIEAMKMEIPITVEVPSEVVEIFGARGRMVNAGDTIAIVRPLPP